MVSALLEPAAHRFVQHRDLGSELALGQLREPFGVAFAIDQCLEHRPPGEPEQVAPDRAEFDAGVLQNLECATSVESPIHEVNSAVRSQEVQRPQRETKPPLTHYLRIELRPIGNPPRPDWTKDPQDVQ